MVNLNLLKNWDIEDLIEAKAYAAEQIDLEFPPLTKSDAMWLTRYEAYSAELTLRAN